MGDCDNPPTRGRNLRAGQYPDKENMVCDAQPRESHMIYELKQKREYHIMQLVNIQKAIDAVNMVSSLY